MEVKGQSNQLGKLATVEGDVIGNLQKLRR